MPRDPQLAPERRRPRGRPARITRDDLVAAAVDLGIDTFSMRTVAERVGVSTPSLYTHVDSREHLAELARHAVRAEVAGFASDANDWRTWLRDFAGFVRSQFGSSASALVLGSPADDGSGAARERARERLDLGEDGLRLLIDAGLDPDAAGHAVWLVFRLATVADVGSGPLAGYLRRTAAVVTHDGELRATRQVQAAMAADADATFAFDLAVALDGIAARIAAANAPSAANAPPASAPSPTSPSRPSKEPT